MPKEISWSLEAITSQNLPSRQGLSHAHRLFFPSRSDFSSLGTGHWRAGLWVSEGHAWISHNFSELEKQESNKAVYKKPRKVSVMTQGYTSVQLVFKTASLMGLSLNISCAWRITGTRLTHNNIIWASFAHYLAKVKTFWDFPGCPVVKNLPVNSGDMASIRGPGSPHVPKAN